MPYTHNAVDLDLVRDMDMILSNVEGYYAIMQEACRESVENDDAATNDVATAYPRAHDDQNGYEWDTFCVCAGIAVRDRILDLVEEDGAKGLALEIIRQRLDLGNHNVWACIAEAFMPNPDDLFDED